MEITLYVNHSEVNKIHKSITGGQTLIGTLRNESDVVTPNIVIKHNNPTGFNYAYIPEFHRYYFITEITAIRTGLWTIKLNSDPLMSFSAEILNCSCILNNTTANGSDNYLTGGNWIAKVKDKTEIKEFPNGLLDSGEFILITAGG